MISKEQLQSTFEDLSRKAKAQGAELEMSIGSGESFSASYQSRQLKKYAANQSQAAVMRVLLGKGTGLATTENLSSEALEQTFNEALQSARDLDRSADPKKLAPQLLKAQNVKELPGIFETDFSDISAAQKLSWAEELEKAALDLDPRITNVPYSGLSHATSERILMNSQGVNLRTRAGQLSAHSGSLAKQGDDSKMAYHSYFGRSAKNFKPTGIAHEGARRTLDLLGAAQPKSGKHHVIFQNDVASDLVGLIVAHFSARALDEGTSLLSNKKNEQVFSKALSWIDDPFQAALPAARAFDAEGAASQITSMVEKGRLVNYLTNSYYARKLNLPHTAHAVRGEGELDVSASNIVVQKGSKSFEELTKLAPEVILITDVTAYHAGYKDATGDFSLPATGFMYRNGERIGALHQFVISGNILDLFKNISDLSNRWNEDEGSSVLTPDFFVPELSIAGKS